MNARADATGAQRHRARPTSRAGHVRRLAPYAVLLVVGAAVLPAYRYHTGLDGVAYLSIARHLAEGRVVEAINGYWSPLYPALTAPFVATGVPPIVAGHITVLLAGLLTLWALVRLSTALGAGRRAADLVALAVTPFLVWAMTYGVFADLLLAGLLLAYAAEVRHRGVRRGRGTGWRAGAFAGLAFLTKAYALPVVAVHLPVAYALHRWGAGRHPSTRTAPRPAAEPRPAAAPHLATDLTIAAGVLLLTVVAWSAVLSLRYGEPTLTTSAEHNVELVSPGSQGNPIFTVGLVEPPTPNAVSAWDEPSTLPVPRDGEDTAGAGSFLRRFSHNVVRNLGATLSALWGVTGAISLAGAVAAGWVLARRRSPAAIGLAVLVATYLAGYLVVWVEARYLWTVSLGLVPFVAVAVQALRWRAAVPVVAVVLLVATAVPAVLDARVRWMSGEETRAVARQLEARGLRGEAVASADHWQRSAIVCLHVRCRYHGIPQAETAGELRRELDGAGVDHYLVWGRPEGPLPSEEQAAAYGSVRLYELGEGGSR